MKLVRWVRRVKIVACPTCEGLGHVAYYACTDCFGFGIECWRRGKRVPLRVKWL